MRIDEQTNIKETIKRQRIKLPILLPLFLAILVLLAVFTFAIYRLQKQHIENEILTRLDNTSRSFNQLLSADSRLLKSVAEFVINDSNIQNTWLKSDREALLNYTTPLFGRLKNNYPITHLYFIDANKVCFLRVHNPARFGDKIERYTLATAEKNGKASCGIELGPYGTFTLRHVEPFFINNTLQGYVEVGEEIEHIMPQLKASLDVDIAILINKSLLNRQQWEEGQKRMGRTGQWDEIKDCVVADSTMSSISPELLKHASQNHDNHKDRIFSINLDGTSYREGFVRLSDASGKDVGDILVIKNTSSELFSMKEVLALITTLCFVIAAVLVSFFYVHITGVEKHLIDIHTDLLSEIDKRKIVESELIKHRDNLEETVRQRTNELETININLQEKISELKLMGNALHQSEDRFKQVSGCAGEWIWEVNAEGLYTYSSPSSEKLLGYKPEEIVGKKYFYDFFTPDIKEELKKAAFEVFAKKESFIGFKNAAVNRNGSVKILETTGLPVLDEAGNLLGYRGVDRDITEQDLAQKKQTQLLEQLEVANNHLKDENTQRTRAEKSLERLNSDLETTVEKLIRSNRQLREFAHLASHDLKTPIRGIGTLAQWIASDYYDKLDENGRRQIDMLIKRTELVDKIVNAILEYSTLTRNKRSDIMINLNELINGIIKQIQPGQNTKITINQKLPSVICEENHIHKVFYNLIENAVKFMDKSEGQITIDCEDEIHFWKFSISDNGPGIEKQHHERIFQLFQTLGDSDRSENTGAGLTFVRKIVELYDGRVWLISKAGQGTTFFFTWPKISINAHNKFRQAVRTKKSPSNR